MKRTNILSILLGALLVRFGITDEEAAAGNAAGGASSDEQMAHTASAPAATAGDAGEQGNGVIESQPAIGQSVTDGSSTDAGAVQGDAGNVAGAATDGAQQAGDAPVGGGDVGNAQAGGSVLDAGTASQSTDEHPLKTRARALRLKFEAEEAVVMEHIVDLLRDIEETL